MAENSNIGWTDHTMNFWWGCERVSAECALCYIGPIMRRAGKGPFSGPIRTRDWSKPRKWQRKAERLGRRLKIFTCSMSDFFHPGADEWRDEAWAVIRDCPGLDWLILTKRPERIADRLPADWGDGYSHVWLGVTVGVRSTLPRVPALKRIPARRRFISAEPLLERLDFRLHLRGIDWMITGCEQAGKPKRRPMEIDWVRDIDRQCRALGIPHFFKQRYENGRITHDGLLDGEVRQAWPAPAAPPPRPSCHQRHAPFGGATRC